MAANSAPFSFSVCKGPSPLVFKEADLLCATEQYIAHQCNCTSLSGKGMRAVVRVRGLPHPPFTQSTFVTGLAASLFERFPHANIYAERRQARNKWTSPGEISIHQGKGRRGVINMLAQISPGKAARTGLDSREKRLQYFKTCLSHIPSIPNIKVSMWCAVDTSWSLPLTGCCRASHSRRRLAAG